MTTEAPLPSRFYFAFLMISSQQQIAAAYYELMARADGNVSWQRGSLPGRLKHSLEEGDG